MNTYFRCLSAELLKTRRTLALWMTLLAPLVIALLTFAMYTQHSDFYMKNAGFSPWKLLSETMLTYWSLMMLPLFITLETALLGQLEHGHKNWKLLYTQPVPRWGIYAAKLTASLGLLALSTWVLLAITVGLGGLLQLLEPDFGFNQPIPWGGIFRLALLSYLAAWLLVSIHLWVSVRFPSFVVAVGVGIAATIFGMLLFGDEAARFYPWTIPGIFSMEMAQRDLVQWVSLGIGWLGSIPLTLLALRDVRRIEIG